MRSSRTDRRSRPASHGACGGFFLANHVHTYRVLLSLAIAGMSAAETRAQVPGPAGSWAGGLIMDGDYTAITLHVADGPMHRAVISFPNRRETATADRVSVKGSRLELFRKTGSERWVGEMVSDTIRGTHTSDEGQGRFELLRTTVVPSRRLRSAVGTYRLPDGTRLSIAYRAHVGDTLLGYFDAGTGEDRWLFPVAPDEFIAGPTFEQPLPVVRRARVLRASDGRVTGLAWQRGADPPLRADRIPFEPDTEAVMARSRAFHRSRDVPGISLGIVTRDGLVWAAGIGHADREAGVAATPATLYQIGSVTKLFTAALLVWARDRRRLSLGDSVGRFLPPAVRFAAHDRRAGRAITLRDLVTHSSGLPADPVNRVDIEGVMQPYGVRDLYAGLSRTPLLHPVGTRWTYSNLGYALLGHAVSRAVGRPYARALQEAVFGPLQMTHSRVGLPADSARVAVHYWPEDTPRRPRPAWRFGEIAGFGGVTSSVEDLARFLAQQLRAGSEDAVGLSGATVVEMQQPVFPMGGASRASGLGWWIRRDDGGSIVLHHGGEVDGHSSFVALLPAQGVGVVVLANLGGSTAQDLGEQVLQIVGAAARRHRIPTRDEAFTLFFSEQWRDAAAALEVIARSRPSDGVAWYRLGIARARLQEFEHARAAFEKAAGLSFMPEDAMYRRARISAATGKAQDALEWLARAIVAGAGSRDEIDASPEFEGLRTDPRWGQIDSLLRIRTPSR